MNSYFRLGAVIWCYMEVTKHGSVNDVTFGFTKIPIKNGAYFVVHNDSFQRIAFIWAKIGQKIGFITNKLEASGVILLRLSGTKLFFC